MIALMTWWVALFTMLAQMALAVRCYKKYQINALETLKSGSKKVSNTNGAKCLVVSGPSGAGKDTMINHLFDRLPGKFVTIVCHTTRMPRKGEVNGIDYHFITRQQFEKMSGEKRFFIEVEEFNHLYGISKEESMNTILNNPGKIVIVPGEAKTMPMIRTALEHVKQLQMTDSSHDQARCCTNIKHIFVTVSGGILELEKRLRLRKTESEEEISARLKKAQQELNDLKTSSCRKNIDYILYNDDLDLAKNQLVSTLKEYFLTLSESC